MSAPFYPPEDDTVQRAHGAASVTRFRVFVVDGPDAGASIELDGQQPSRSLVGTGPGCDLRLRDRSVSRRHLALDVENGRLRVTDLQSTNGTFVNSLAVFDAALRGGELICAGDTSLRVERFDDASPAHLSSTPMYGRIIGASAEMRRLYALFNRVAQADVATVIEGEPGTGKELLAEVLHERSARARGPLVFVDCGAVSPSDPDGPLFGAEGGAPGYLEQARGGTLVLDDVDVLSPAVQARLARVLKRREIQRGGAGVPIDVRTIATSCRDLDREVQAGRFREDLYLHLSTARVTLPALRNRKGDVPVLAEYFWQRLRGADAPFPADFLRRVEDYAWPGNVRELIHRVSRLAALGDAGADGSDEDKLSLSPAGDLLEQIFSLELPLPRARQLLMDEFSRRYVERVVKVHGGNVTRAAAASGLALRYFQLLRSRHRR
jgi:DNA-binding NtrC family response regulator